jgi:hypothetical protein
VIEFEPTANVDVL